MYAYIAYSEPPGVNVNCQCQSTAER